MWILTIRRPERFLNESVLQSPKAWAWLVSRLSVNRRAPFGERLKGQYLGVWMVTGIQIVEDGEVGLARRSGRVFGTGFTIP